MTLYCPITYEMLENKDGKYSPKGLSLLSKNLSHLADFPYTRDEQIEKARLLATKLSIQGVQPKLSVTLNTKEQTFILTDRGGTFILKPQNMLWPQLPENEDLTMRLAKLVGIETPLHGLVYCKDGSLSYWIRRFDRPSQKSPLTKKLAVEDFAQLSGANRQTKYQSSMEKVAKVIEDFTTFPMLEKEKLFTLTLFSYLCGNEDMHLKNFSLIQRNGITTLSPAYDLLNTTIAMGKQTKEELALPVNGKKNKISREDLLTYFAETRLEINPKRIERIVQTFHKAYPEWLNLIKISFLTTANKQAYIDLLDNRLKKLGSSISITD